ncbi:NAD(P)/FAD-dependent oxidoreductase [Stagnihabitans tardus]|uniref:FAD-dependent oxidoreductase n=1 Tax=Stagnihabitans tardus TaxID=2699202 RepID=A0AAE5BTU2_9RHOB|nr:FAD-binding oxidoreductase [Stagnihabitans tardus]NBZ89435.1 FAD-dependent oxidoreductase [Stagnihabitans tardus]
MNLLHVNDKQGAYPPSYYAATAVPFPALPSLEGDVAADVCVVGGGYTGLSAALHLGRRGYRVVLLEAQRLGFGASGRNGGQVGSGQRQDQDWLEKSLGQTKARALWDLAEEAKDLVKAICQDAGLDYAPGVAVACHHAGEVREAHAYAEKLSRDYGYQAIETLDQDAIRGLIGSQAFKGGIIDRSAGHIHPLNFALAIARAAQGAGAMLFENSEVTGLAEGMVTTAKGSVRAKHILLACNGYLGDLQPKVAARVMPINNFILATEPLGDAAKVLSENIAVYDTRFVVNYWRLSEDNRLLFGGGESYGYRFPDILKTVRKPMLEIYPQLRDARIDYAWGGTLAITTNRLPCFTRPAPGMLSASGYSGHGVAFATLAGKIMAEAVAGQEERFDLMAGIPQMPFPGGAALRHPLLVMAMLWYGMRDRLGV